MLRLKELHFGNSDAATVCKCTLDTIKECGLDVGPIAAFGASTKYNGIAARQQSSIYCIVHCLALTVVETANQVSSVKAILILH